MSLGYVDADRTVGSGPRLRTGPGLDRTFPRCYSLKFLSQLRNDEDGSYRFDTVCGIASVVGRLQVTGSKKLPGLSARLIHQAKPSQANRLSGPSAQDVLSPDLFSKQWG